MKSNWRTCAIAAALAIAAPAFAEDPPTPTSAKGFDVVSPEQARGLLGKAAFYDMRSAINYGKGHLQGAVALPYDQKSEKAEAFDASKDRFDMAKLPGDKAKTVVFYSDGPTGWKSYKAAVLAARAGYRDVKWMREGTAGWTAKGFPLE
ncbi:MAG TPA: rhodanese-like domain-containing protein [Usitatibacter sp.]|nr:rhodanese-like domain-containing protein [Usitatibacter sp.]